MCSIWQLAAMDHEYRALLKNVVNPIISSSRLAKKFSTILVFYDNDNVGFNKTLESHLNTSRPIAEVDPSGFINVSNEYVSTLNKTLETHYPTKTQGIIEELKFQQTQVTQALKPRFKGGFTYRVLSLYSFRSRVKELMNAKKFPLRFSPSIQAIRELNSICNPGTSCTPYVVYIPNSNYWRPNNQSNAYKLLLEETSRSLSIDFLDSSSVINPNDKSNYAPIGPHLSQVGNTKLASFIVSKIDQN